jgi:hypothetical protein
VLGIRKKEHLPHAVGLRAAKRSAIRKTILERANLTKGAAFHLFNWSPQLLVKGNPLDSAACPMPENYGVNFIGYFSVSVLQFVCSIYILDCGGCPGSQNKRSLTT